MRNWKNDKNVSHMKIAVGSTNPVKINAVKRTFKKVFGNVEVVGIKVDSHVSNQPFHEDVMKGAINRAKDALKLTNADFGVGIEGGVTKFGKKWYNLGFVAIINKHGKLGTGTSGWFECPPKILKKLKEGEELGDVIDKIVGKKNVKRKEGAIGIFTMGMVTRTKLYEHGVFMALVPFLSKKIFDK